MEEIKLGMKVRDKVTGLVGIAVAYLRYMNGCVRYEIAPPVGKDGKVHDGLWVDSQQIEIMGKGLTVEPKKTGGPGSVPKAMTGPRY